jgi:VCBS repeat-containing protein
MNRILFKRSLVRTVLVLAVLLTMAGPSSGADVTVLMKAEARAVDMPDGNSSTAIPMWGFFDDGDTGTIWAPGPTLRLIEGDNLTIQLTNNLSEAVSLVVPGQAAAGTPVFVNGRVRSFTDETQPGGTFTYTWNGLKAGTYLYESGTDPAKQVQMGLYGALIVDAIPATTGNPAQAYAGDGYDSEVILLYSEIDPALHAPPSVAKPLDYVPAYYLINGKPYEAGDAPFPAGDVSQDVLFRFLNAGLKTHVPMLLNAPYMRVIAEDGNRYPYGREQYSVLLAAGKTTDAIWRPTAQGTFALVDRTNTLTNAGASGGGMLANLQVATAAGAPVAMDDSATVSEGGNVTIDVLLNDTGANALQPVLVTAASNGSLTLNADGTFSYFHDSSEAATDFFTYAAMDTVTSQESNVATVSITVTPLNDPPVANDDQAAMVPDTTVTIDILANDSDVDGDPLTVTNVTDPRVTVNPDQTVMFTPDAGFTGATTFTYTANDGTVDSNPATVTVTVSAPGNTAPLAVDDSAQTPRNTVVFLNLTANDTDADSNLKDGYGNVAASQITIVAQPTRGTLNVLTNGVNFTPRNNFKGTDMFTYTVRDLLGAESNVATVTVNVTK